MKRSEMVTLLSYKLEQQFGKRDLIVWSADSILSFLEEWGMKPPAVKTGEFTGHISSMSRNEWEPED
jgi:hypothetical protein